MALSVTPLIQNPVALLQKLIQFDTTNPPGNERDCVLYIQGLLAEAGIETQLLAKSAERPNLVARLPGSGQSAPLLLYGHVDVVTTENQTWTYPPFEGKLVDGYVWGRGALDMKGGVAMLLTAFLRARLEGLQPPGDVVLAIVGDEEAGSDFGAKFLVENHPEQFAGIRYALGEFGGFTFTVGKKHFYPIAVAEKQICWMKATVRGPGGHGAAPVRNGALFKLGRMLQIIGKQRLPVHVTPIVHQMFSAFAANMEGVNGFVLKQLLNPLFTDRVLDLLGERGRIFDPLFHHTVSPTILYGSTKINVIPSAASVELDGRLLPGYKPEDLIQELRQVCPGEVEFEVTQHDPGPTAPDMGLFDTLAGILREADPTAIPLPFVLGAVTDGRIFSRLGIQTYGFLPMQLPDNFNFNNTIHSADERIPAMAVEFGANAIYEVMQRFI